MADDRKKKEIKEKEVNETELTDNETGEAVGGVYIDNRKKKERVYDTESI